nr:hypothetical protein [Tanacetum cinerariifolium]
MPPTPDLCFIGLDEFVNKPVAKNCKARSSEEETKSLRKNDSAPTIKEWVLDNEKVNVTQPKIKKKIVRLSIIESRILEENLHIRFSESIPNVVGSGPDWLFAINALIRTMNFEPIVAGTQSNGFAGIKASDNAVMMERMLMKIQEKKIDDIQAKIDTDYQLAKRLQAQEPEELFDAKKATLIIQLLEKKRKHFAAKRSEEKRNKPPTQAQKRKIMRTYLENIEGYKLK